ncbi:MAG: polysaccharide pyruvyl transferase family protein [Oscillospiraceae bacterium]|nr:polysaccharide pyruvyl transferase family protein [Oscillospiraceae bacterium]
MNVKIITCHDVYNRGASLQAYALQCYLQDMGHSVQIIDYKPPYLSGHYKLWNKEHPKYSKNFVLNTAYNLAKLPQSLKSLETKRVFDSFKEEYLCLTDKRYTSNAELKADTPPADVYIAGSDQIWNTQWQNGRDPAFFLAFAPEGSKKISYAASMSSSMVEPELLPEFLDRVGALDSISLREQSSAEFLNAKLKSKRAVQVLDPVFLLPRSRWEALAMRSSAEAHIKEPYLFVYEFGDNPAFKELAQKISAKHGLKIISLFKSDYAARCLPKAGPLEFLRLIEGANFVLSSSFHATAFSVIFRKEFLVLPRQEDINLRMSDLLEGLDLSERMSALSPSSSIDYSSVEVRLAAAVEASKAFLKEAVRGR